MRKILLNKLGALLTRRQLNAFRVFIFIYHLYYGLKHEPLDQDTQGMR